MARTENPQSVEKLLSLLLAPGQRTPLEARQRAFMELRQQSPAAADAIILDLLKLIDERDRGLHQGKAAIEELRREVEQLAGMLWYPAIFIDFVGDPTAGRALVAQGSICRAVGIWEKVDATNLIRGCEVFLNHSLSGIVAINPSPARPIGDIAVVQETTPRGSLIVRSSGDQDVEVETAAGLKGTRFEAGDRVRWYPTAQLATAKIERAQEDTFLLGEVPDLQLTDLGGHRHHLQKLINMLSAVLVAPAKAAEYGLSGRGSILLTGAPGNGKTLLTRIAISEINRRYKTQVRCHVVAPAEWENPYVGVTQATIKNLFQSLRASATRGQMAVLVLDEIECVGRVRGAAHQQVADKFLNVILSALDGFSGREGVAVVSITNRKDLVDKALLQRISDHEIFVAPPDIRSAREIFACHLRPPPFPYHPNGDQASTTRKELIEAAVATLFLPNSPFAQIARIKYRDSKVRVVLLKELVSGRLISQIALAACRSAYEREIQTGERGVQLRDMEEAVCDAVERLTGTLTIHNVRDHLELPTDVDVVAVERVLPRVLRTGRYIETWPARGTSNQGGSRARIE